MATTSRSANQAAASMPMPGSLSKKASAPWLRNTFIQPVRSSTMEPGRTLTPWRRSQASSSAGVMAWPAGRWGAPVSAHRSRSTPGPISGGHLSMPSFAAPFERTPESGNPLNSASSSAIWASASICVVPWVGSMMTSSTDWKPLRRLRPAA